jgi:hypothetical protein
VPKKPCATARIRDSEKVPAWTDHQPAGRKRTVKSIEGGQTVEFARWRYSENRACSVWTFTAGKTVEIPVACEYERTSRPSTVVAAETGECLKDAALCDAKDCALVERTSEHRRPIERLIRPFDQRSSRLLASRFTELEQGHEATAVVYRKIRPRSLPLFPKAVP